MKILFVQFVLVVMTLSAWAGPNCIDTTDAKGCDPDLLCTFKSEYYAKLVGYMAYVMNDPKTAASKTGIDGIYASGELRADAIAQAKLDLPKGTASEQSIRAGAIFQNRIAKLIATSFEEPPCNYGGKLIPSKLPKKGYDGMHTTEQCNVRVDFEAGDFDPEGFGSTHTTCGEFYTRDFAHEKIHKKICEQSIKDHTNVTRYEIDNIIPEEIKAYKHSIRLSEAYMRFLNLRCSKELKDKSKIQSAINDINSLLSDFQGKQK